MTKESKKPGKGKVFVKEITIPWYNFVGKCWPLRSRKYLKTINRLVYDEGYSIHSVDVNRYCCQFWKFYSYMLIITISYE